MTALMIIGSVILFTVLLLNFPVTVHVSFYDRRLKYTVKYLGICLFPKREKVTRRKKRRRKKPSKDPPGKSLPEEGEEIFEDIAEIGLFDEEMGTEVPRTEIPRTEVPRTDISQGDVPPEDVPGEDVRGEKPVHPAVTSGGEPEVSQAAEDVPGEKNEPDKQINKTKNKTNEAKKEPEKPGKKKPGKGKKAKREKPPEEAEKKTLSGILEDLENKKDAAALLWELCGGRVTRLLGKVRITGLVIDFAAAHEDAAKAAVSYGVLCAAFYDLLGVLTAITPIGISSIKIDCLYNTPSEKSRYDCEAKIKLRPASAVNALLGIAGGYIAGAARYKPAIEEFTKK